MATENASGYKTLNVGIGKAHTAAHEALEGLAATLKCKASGLVWEAIERLLKDPPTEAPAGAQVATGTASGYWTIPVLNDKGKAVGMKVVEVEKRADETGRAFFRYKVEDGAPDMKARKRARGQAIRAATYDLTTMLGLKPDKLTVDEFDFESE